MKTVKAINCDVYSRCVGYYTPVQQWNKGKQSEYADRHQQSTLDVSKAVRGDDV